MDSPITMPHVSPTPRTHESKGHRRIAQSLHAYATSCRTSTCRRGGSTMTLDKRTLSSIDRKIGAELDSQERFRMVRVPIDDRGGRSGTGTARQLASRWDEVSPSLIEQELAAVATGTSKEVARDAIPVEAERTLRPNRPPSPKSKSASLLKRDDSRQWERQLEYRRDELRRLELRLRSPAPPPQSTSPRRNVGRNDPCPCGSGVKYKRCHGR